MSPWPTVMDDVGDAVDKYGRLYTLYSIASAAESSPKCLTRENIVPVQVALTPASDAKVKVRMQKTTVVAIKNYLGEDESSGYGVIKNAHSLIVKLDPYFFGGSWNVRKMDMNGTGLADTVEPANSLLHELGVFGEVPKDEVMGKLEVAPFATDLGTEEYAGPFRIGKVGGLTIALDEV